MPQGRKEVTARMVDLSFQLSEDANTLEVVMLMYSISSVLQWFFFIIVAIIIANYIKKENAIITHKKKHSQKTKRKGR